MPPEKEFEPNAQDPHMLAQCPVNPEVAWVQHHNGVFRFPRRSDLPLPCIHAIRRPPGSCLR
jgi:hypothetical protein